MAKTKEKKNYTVRIAFDRISLSMNEKGSDGYYHSINAPYPMSDVIYNEDGTKTIKRLTRKQTEQWLLKQLGYAV